MLGRNVRVELVIDAILFFRRVDVYRGEMMTPSNALQEKVITIRGQPDNCVNACREILKVMKADSESKGKSM